MAEDHEAPEAGQFPTVWTRGRKETEKEETESPKSERRKESVARRNKQKSLFRTIRLSVTSESEKAYHQDNKNVKPTSTCI